MDEAMNKAFLDMVIQDNKEMKEAGNNLAIAALRVTTEYDGIHRLRLAIAEWAKTVANEGGRGRVPV